MTLPFISLSRFLWIALFVLGGAVLVLPADTGWAQTPSYVALPGFPQNKGFQKWITDFWPVARHAGIRWSVYDAVFHGMTLDEDVLERIDEQAEFVQPVWHYLERATSEKKISDGRAKMEEWHNWITKISETYGVDPCILVTIWGMESSYGNILENTKLIKNTFQALASLAYAGGRYRDYARTQLIAALKIVQSEERTPEELTGSWAGAMGHTQFIPTTYAEYAVDFDGDGHRNVWESVPDALASTAHYLKKSGWKSGETWGYEVILPKNFNYHLVGKYHKRPLADWQKKGIRRAHGAAFPRSDDEAFLFLPAGAKGPAFLLIHNFSVIKRYNNSDAYALAIGHLADRLRGGGAFVQDWPKDNPPLSRTQIRRLQEYLAKKGYSIGEIDGHFGAQTRAALRAYQKKRGWIPDGYAGVQISEHLPLE